MNRSHHLPSHKPTDPAISAGTDKRFDDLDIETPPVDPAIVERLRAACEQELEDFLRLENQNRE